MSSGRERMMHSSIFGDPAPLQKEIQNAAPAKTSVKVHHAPGGQSSNIFGGGYQEEPRRTGRAAVAAPTNNVAPPAPAAHTSVKVHHAPGGSSQMNLGWDEPVRSSEAKTSVRVHAAPGGQSQINLSDHVESHSKAAARAQATSSIFNHAPEEVKSSVRVHAAPGGHSQINFDDGSSAVKTSVKVHHAPGGASSFSLAHEPERVSGRAGARDPNKSSISFGAGNDAAPERTSVRVRHAPGGGSQISF